MRKQPNRQQEQEIPAFGTPGIHGGLGRGGAESRGTWVESACRGHPLLHFTGPGSPLYLHPPALKEKEAGLQSGEIKTEGYLFRQTENPKNREIKRESAKGITSP